MNEFPDSIFQGLEIMVSDVFQTFNVLGATSLPIRFQISKEGLTPERLAKPTLTPDT